MLLITCGTCSNFAKCKCRSFDGAVCRAHHEALENTSIAQTNGSKVISCSFLQFLVTLVQWNFLLNGIDNMLSYSCSTSWCSSCPGCWCPLYRDGCTQEATSWGERKSWKVNITMWSDSYVRAVLLLVCLSILFSGQCMFWAWWVLETVSELWAWFF